MAKKQRKVGRGAIGAKPPAQSAPGLSYTTAPADPKNAYRERRRESGQLRREQRGG